MGRKPKETPQWLPDEESPTGTMEPERNDDLDREIEAYLEAKATIAECRETMERSREAIIAIAGRCNMNIYDYHRGDTVFRVTLDETVELHLKKVDTE